MGISWNWGSLAVWNSNFFQIAAVVGVYGERERETAEEKISHTDHVSIYNFDTLLLLDVSLIVFVPFIHLLHYSVVDCGDWIFGSRWILFIYLFCLILVPWAGSELGWGPKDGEEGMDQKGFRRQAHSDLGMERDGVAGERGTKDNATSSPLLPSRTTTTHMAHNHQH